MRCILRLKKDLFKFQEIAKGSPLKPQDYYIRKCFNFLLAKRAENILIISHEEIQYTKSNFLEKTLHNNFTVL